MYADTNRYRKQDYLNDNVVQHEQSRETGYAP